MAKFTVTYYEYCQFGYDRKQVVESPVPFYPRIGEKVVDMGTVIAITIDINPSLDSTEICVYCK